MIYFIQAENGGPIKIGYTKSNPEARLNSLQCGNSEKLLIIKYIDGERDDECKLHEAFKDYKLQGEWFEESIDILEYIDRQDQLEDNALCDSVKNGIKIDVLLYDIEEKYLKKALQIHNFNKHKAAGSLGISYRSMRYRMDGHKIKTLDDCL